MRKAARSFGHAWEGVVHAMKYERNFRLFVLGHTLLMVLGIAVRFPLGGLIFASFMAGIFMITELLNTAVERVTDTFDDHLKTERGGHEHPGVKMAKDVSSAASLVALMMYGFALLLVLLPYLIPFIATR